MISIPFFEIPFNSQRSKARTYDKSILASHNLQKRDIRSPQTCLQSIQIQSKVSLELLQGAQEVEERVWG